MTKMLKKIKSWINRLFASWYKEQLVIQNLLTQRYYYQSQLIEAQALEKANENEQYEARQLYAEFKIAAIERKLRLIDAQLAKYGIIIQDKKQ